MTSEEAIPRRAFDGRSADLVSRRMMSDVVQVSTGFEGFDRAFGLWGRRRGIPRGQYVVIGGASNVGKSRYGSRLLRNAVDAGEPAALVSLEDSVENLLALYYQQLDVIPWAEWSRRWTTEHRNALRQAVVAEGQNMQAPLHVVSSESRSSLDQVLGTMEELVLSSGVRFFVLDHIQLVKDHGAMSEYQQSVAVSEAIRSFKARHGVTVVALSQLNRQATRERHRSPVIQDLHGGTSLESNSDTVILLDHSRYEVDEAVSHVARTWFVLGKNRLGPKDFEVPVEIDHSRLAYQEGHPDEAELRWPQHGGRDG